MNETLVIIGTLLGGYLFLHGLEFSWKLLFRAPVALDIEQFNESETLRSRIQILECNRDPAEEHHFRSARESLATISPTARHLLTHLWTSGPLKSRRGQLKLLDMDRDVARASLERLVALKLVHVEIDRDHTGPFEKWEISPGYKNALGQLLFEENS